MPVHKFTEVTALSDRTSDIVTNVLPPGGFRVEVTLPQVKRQKEVSEDTSKPLRTLTRGRQSRQVLNKTESLFLISSEREHLEMLF